MQQMSHNRFIGGGCVGQRLHLKGYKRDRDRKTEIETETETDGDRQRQRNR